MNIILVGLLLALLFSFLLLIIISRMEEGLIYCDAADMESWVSDQLILTPVKLDSGQYVLTPVKMDDLPTYSEEIDHEETKKTENEGIKK